MSVVLTQMSDKEYQLIASGQMQPKMAAQYLKEERLQMRTFSSVLREMYNNDDLLLRLIQQFQDDSPEANPKSITKKIQNWLNDKNKPTNREDIFHIGFALRLTVVQVNTLLGACTDYGIHYRDSLDVVYSWFLRNQRSFYEAKKFLNSLPPLPLYDQLGYNTQSKNITQELRSDFLLTQTEQELRECYLAYWELLRMKLPHLEKVAGIHSQT